MSDGVSSIGSMIDDGGFCFELKLVSLVMIRLSFYSSGSKQIEKYLLALQAARLPIDVKNE